MITNQDLHASPASGTIVNTDDIVSRPPPLLEVGPLAWVHKNLLSSWVDVLLTCGSLVLIIVTISSFLSWAVSQANWFVISFNIRLLMLGRFPADAEWRVVILVGIGILTIGINLAAWTRIPRRVSLTIIGLLFILFIGSEVIRATITLSPSYLAVGNREIASGSATETPQPNLGFIAKAGETIVVQRADALSRDDQALGGMHGFADKAAGLLANAAADRLESMAQAEAFKVRLSSDTLTDGQRTRLNTQLSKIQIQPAVTEIFSVNQGTVLVRILDGKTLNPLASGRLTNATDVFTATLPANGWYVLEKKTADESDPGSAILQVQGIYPLIAQQVIRSATPDTNSGSAGSDQAVQYIRVTDSFATFDTRPVVDDKNVPMAIVFDNPYRGSHTLTDFLSLFVRPFFDVIKVPLLALFVIGALGYFIAKWLDQNFAPIEHRHQISRRMGAWLLIALPVLMFGLVYGVGSILPLTDTRRWGGLLLTVMLTVVATIASFPIGILLALGRRSSLPAISLASTLYIEFVRGVPLITVLFMAQLLVPLINPTLAEMPNVFRAMIAITLFNAAYLAENVRGGLQAIPHGQVEAAKALGLHSWQITLDITLPQALRAVLPALVGMVISLFKDTSLVTIVGLLDLTGTAQNIVTQTEFIGLRRETLIFITLIYFGISYGIAAVSRRIERTGSGATLSRTI